LIELDNYEPIGERMLHMMLAQVCMILVQANTAKHKRFTIQDFMLTRGVAKPRMSQKQMEVAMKAAFGGNKKKQ